jgi:hypothetical protein
VITLFVSLFGLFPGFLALFITTIQKEQAKVYQSTTCAIVSLARSEARIGGTYYYYNVGYIANGIPRARTSQDAILTQLTGGQSTTCKHC